MTDMLHEQKNTVCAGRDKQTKEKEEQQQQ